MSQSAYESIATADGTGIAARFFAAPGAARSAVLIVPAMGAPQGYYRPFAQWLAAQGHVVATFDYRGIGRSRPQTLRGFQADVLTWAERDCAAMIEAIAARAPGAPLVWIGHSLGGQIVPMVPNRARIAKIVTVATGSGYWREYSPRMRPFGGGFGSWPCRWRRGSSAISPAGG